MKSWSEWEKLAHERKKDRSPFSTAITNCVDSWCEIFTTEDPSHLFRNLALFFEHIAEAGRSWTRVRATWPSCGEQVVWQHVMEPSLAECSIAYFCDVRDMLINGPMADTDIDHAELGGKYMVRFRRSLKTHFDNAGVAWKAAEVLGLTHQLLQGIRKEQELSQAAKELWRRLHGIRYRIENAVGLPASDARAVVQAARTDAGLILFSLFQHGELVFPRSVEIDPLIVSAFEHSSPSLVEANAQNWFTICMYALSGSANPLSIKWEHRADGISVGVGPSNFHVDASRIVDFLSSLRRTSQTKEEKQFVNPSRQRVHNSLLPSDYAQEFMSGRKPGERLPLLILDMRCSQSDFQDQSCFFEVDGRCCFGKENDPWYFLGRTWDNDFDRTITFYTSVPTCCNDTFPRWAAIADSAGDAVRTALNETEYPGFSGKELWALLLTQATRDGHVRGEGPRVADPGENKNIFQEMVENNGEIRTIPKAEYYTYSDVFTASINLVRALSMQHTHEDVQTAGKALRRGASSIESDDSESRENSTNRKSNAEKPPEYHVCEILKRMRVQAGKAPANEKSNARAYLSRARTRRPAEYAAAESQFNKSIESATNQMATRNFS